MPDKILIIQTAFIGDVVLATAVVENLRHAMPEATIDFLVRKGNESLLHEHPYINRVLVWNKRENKNRNLLRIISEIRKERYNKVINVQRYAATGLITAFSRAGERIGFDKNPLSFLFTRKVKHTFNRQHEIERNHSLISHFISDPVARPRLYPTSSDTDSVQKYIQRSFITISPASVWFTKQFPVIKWAAFLNGLPEELAIYILGGKDDRSLGEALIQMTNTKSPVNLCGELTFLQSAALMQSARMNFVNDSAPMHFASAVNAPVTAIYCSTIPAFGYGPLSDVKHVVELRNPLYCRPCGLHGYSACPEGHFRCAMEIKEDQLFAALR